MSPNPENTGYVNTGYVGSNGDLSQVVADTILNDNNNNNNYNNTSLNGRSGRIRNSEIDDDDGNGSGGMIIITNSITNSRNFQNHNGYDHNQNQIYLKDFRKISDNFDDHHVFNNNNNKNNTNNKSSLNCQLDYNDIHNLHAHIYNRSKSDLDITKEEKVNNGEYEIQSAFQVFRQMFIPFTIAGFGSVFAGIVLNMVTKWEVFDEIPQLEIMVPAFLGLIGNIETTLASRLSTHANLGTLDTWSGLFSIMLGNILVVQCQSSTVGLFAALSSLLMSTFKSTTRNAITIEKSLLLASGSVVASIISNTLLSTVISIVIVVSRKFRINPGIKIYFLFTL